MENVNEVKKTDDDEVFEILDMEEKLDYKVWGNDNCSCNNNTAGCGDRQG